MYALALSVLLSQSPRDEARAAIAAEIAKLAPKKKPAEIPLPADYRAVLARVKAGETLTVYAGLRKMAVAQGVEVSGIPGQQAGVYRCWYENGDAVMCRYPEARTAAIVEEANRARPFERSAGFTPGTSAASAAGRSLPSQVLDLHQGRTGMPARAAIRGSIKGCST